MAEKSNWQVVGLIEELKANELQEIEVDSKKIALSYKDGEFGAISGFCNHLGGPLGNGSLDGDYIVCPWHYWRFHRVQGEGQGSFKENRVQRYELKETVSGVFM